MPVDLLTSQTKLVRQGQPLDSASARQVAHALADPSIPDEPKARFLTALHDRGETADEVAAFAEAFRELSADAGAPLRERARHAIDFVGTGGDRSGAFNISTTVCFILAAGGVTVMKHGNRGATSTSGSADLLGALGFPLARDLDAHLRSLDALNMAFFFAPAWHPAFKAIGPVRKTLAAEGKRTVFNILGPLLNPGRPGRQVLGVFADRWVRPLAHSLALLGVERGLVVHGIAGDGVIDKFSTAGPMTVAGVGSLADAGGTWTAEQFGLPAATLADLQGGDAAGNLRQLLRFADDSETLSPGLRDTLLLNAAAGFFASGDVPSIEAGLARAREVLESGALKDWLKRARDHFA